MRDPQGSEMCSARNCTVAMRTRICRYLHVCSLDSFELERRDAETDIAVRLIALVRSEIQPRCMRRRDVESSPGPSIAGTQDLGSPTASLTQVRAHSIPWPGRIPPASWRDFQD